MKFPHAEYKINDRAIHERTKAEGVIHGISREGDKLVYLFDCPLFRQWVPSYKLMPVNEASTTVIDEEVQYKSFDLHLVDSRGATTVLVRVSLANELEYEVAFNRADYCKARALYDFIQSQDTISESFLSMIGLEKTDDI